MFPLQPITVEKIRHHVRQQFGVIREDTLHRNIRYFVATVGCFAFLLAPCYSQPVLAEDGKPRESLLLWPDGAPGALGNDEKDQPKITVHRPAAGTANGCSVIVCPGGGYGHLASSYEGHDVADWFNTFGVTGIVLRYRHAPEYHHPSPLLDVQRAIRTVRANSKQWNLDPGRIGVMGFSAGGHLTSTAGTHFDSGNPDASDPIDRLGCRPDFLILAYPVISMKQFSHGGSRRNLLGDNPDPKLVESLSNELQVTSQTPPSFLFHTHTDQAVPVENSVLFYLALRKARVPAELHVYERGRHGVGLGVKDPVLATWPGRLRDWMQVHEFLKTR